MQATGRLDRRTIRDIINNPHDALFRGLISDDLRAHALIRDHLPGSIFGIPARGVVRQVSLAFVDGFLRQSFADGVFEIGGTPGKPERAAILEHKRKAARMTLEQLVGYVISVARHYAANGVWPEIVVLVIHTGPRALASPGSGTVGRRGYVLSGEKWSPSPLCP